MAATTDVSRPRMGIWRRIRRWLTWLAFGYLGILIVLLALENWFIYRPVTADAIVDRADPIRPFATSISTCRPASASMRWWWPRSGATGAMLYCHGNAGNLSHRGGGSGPLG